MPKSIKGSVGQGGNNWSATDVATIQYLLNCVPASKGGPSPELVIDGVVGPKTIGAVRKFQQANFGWADGKVDPFGQTLKTLQGFDPDPNHQLGSGAAKAGSGKGAGDPWGKSGKSGAGKTGSDPWGKSGGKAGGGDPWGKSGGYKSGGNDPWGKSGGKAGGSDPWGKSGGYKSGGADPWGKSGGKMGGGKSGW